MEQKKILNICLVSREYPPETGWGGIGNYTYNLAHSLSDLGCSVHVIAQSLDVDKDYLDDDVHIHRIAHKTIFPFKGYLREFCLRLEYSRCVYLKLKELIKKFHIQIVEAPNFSAEGLVYSLLKKTPLVTRLHTHFSEIIEFSKWPKTLDRRLSCLLEEAAILRSDLITCSTKAHMGAVFGEIGFPGGRVEHIPLGIHLPQIKEGYDGDKKIPPSVLFVGRLEARKGVHALVKAVPHVLRELPETIFYIVGRDTFVTENYISFSGSRADSFKARLISEIPEGCRRNVIFPGYLERDELNKYYESCSIFVAPSLYESFGFIYIEAMSYAKPVIGCGVGGVPEVIEDGVSGLLVPPEDHLALARGILRLLNDGPLMAIMGANARERVRNSFTDVAMAKKSLRAYSDILYGKIDREDIYAQDR